MIIAYADPPYPGWSGKYRHHPDYAGEVDHQALITRLGTEFPDGWALSTSSSALRDILSLCPPDVRVGAWVKRYAVWRKGVNPVYAWEPVIFRGGRRPDPKEKVFDWVSCIPVMHHAVPGQKPDQFCWWLFRMLGLTPMDTVIDLYPGSGAVTHAWARWQHQLPA